MNEDFGLEKIPANNRVGSRGICPSGEFAREMSFRRHHSPDNYSDERMPTEDLAMKEAEVSAMWIKVRWWLLAALVIAAVLSLVYWDTRV